MDAAAAAGPSSGPIAAALDVAVSDENSSNNDSTDPTAAAARPPPKKRRRLVISCIECHRRKQKCDRGYPCTNCRSRGKGHVCRYETAAAPGAKAGGGSGRSKAAPAPSASENTPAPPASGGDDGTGTGKAANFGYAAAGGASTMGFLRRIDRATSSPGLAGDSLTRITAEAGRLADDFGTRERYRCLIRQLPARVYVEKLVGVFFEKYNIQYYPLEYDVFMAQLAEWNSLPFSVFTTVGPRGLSPTLRAFPAVLFQVAAMGLLSLGSDEPHPVYDALKYAGDMTFEDLASDYSESGVAVLSLLGKRQMSLCTVQAGFIRCSFLKYMAQVTEAWHAIGAAIRDAQEIGLHREDQDPRPVVVAVAAGVGGEGEDDAAAAAVLRNQWEVQHRRSLWHMLCLWDVHTGLVLGRPLTTDGDAQPPLPVDCPVPTGGLEARSRTAVLPRGPDDPPTPMTRNLWTVRLLPLLREVARLEASGPCPRDFDRVDQIHREMEALEAQIPPCFRVDNPDTRFDDHPACRGWLRGVRTILPQLASFGYFVLHRPYVFTRPRSRAVALRACVDMLRGQRAQFEGMAPDEHRSFAVFFGTFDAIVLLATVFVLFPREHPDLLPDALQHFAWAVERFEVLSRRNNLARSAVAVLRAIWVRLQRSLAYSSAVVPVDPWLAAAAAAAADSDVISPFSSGSGFLGVTPSTASAATAAVPSTSDVSISGGDGNGHENSSAGGLDTLLLARTSAEPWSLPSDFDWSSIQTLYPTTDLAYNELMTVDHDAFAGAGGFPDDGGTGTAGPAELQAWPPPPHGFFGSGGGEGDAPASGVVPAGAAASGTGLAGADSGGTQGQQNNTAWQFEGDFGDDSIWQVLNLYTPF